MVYVKVHQIKSERHLKTSGNYITDEAKTVELSNDAALDRSMSYIQNQEKTLLVGESSQADFPILARDGQKMKQLVSSYGILDPKTAAEEFSLTRRAAEISFKQSGRKKEVLAHHVIQSFSPEDNLTPEEIHEIGRQTILELTGGEHEFIIATHLDKGHIHNHIIFNSTNFLTHKQFRWEKKTWGELAKISDKYADLAGAKILENQSKFTYREYAAYRKKNIYKLEIKERLDFLLKHSTSLADFKLKAEVLNLAVDFSGKFVKYRLLDQGQDRRTRDDTLSKTRKYSMEKIESRVVKNDVTYSIHEIKEQYDLQKKAKEEDFEMRVVIEGWQVVEETSTGIYLEMDYGIRNQGTIKIPYRQVDKLENGDYELFIKKTDFFYFMNPDKSSNNRYLKGETLVKQLSKNSGEYVVRKNHRIGKLDQLIKEFEFLSVQGASNGEQFEDLHHRFIEQLEKTEFTLEQIDSRLSTLNKIHSALLDYQSDVSISKELAADILKELHVPYGLDVKEIEKEIIEVTAEKQALEDKLEVIEKNYLQYEEIKENVEERRKEGELHL